MAKVGRPAFVLPDLKKVEDLAATGLTQEQIAHCIGIHPSTLCEKKQEFAELADAIKRGAARGISQITNALFESARNGNTTAQIFFLKARAQWREATNIEAHVIIRQEDALELLG